MKNLFIAVMAVVLFDRCLEYFRQRQAPGDDRRRLR